MKVEVALSGMPEFLQSVAIGLTPDNERKSSQTNPHGGREMSRLQIGNRFAQSVDVVNRLSVRRIALKSNIH